MLNGELKFLQDSKRPVFLAVRPKEIPYVEIMWASLGGGDGMLSSLLHARELKGLVLADFGAGNVPPSWVLTDTKPGASPRRGRWGRRARPGRCPQNERLRGLL